MTNIPKIDTDVCEEYCNKVKVNQFEEINCRAIAKSFKGEIYMKVRIYKNLTGKSLKPGDLFVGRRNTGWELGVCSYVDDGGYVISSDVNTYGFTQIYPYDNHEIRKVDKILSYNTKDKD